MHRNPNSGYTPTESSSFGALATPAVDAFVIAPDVVSSSVPGIVQQHAPALFLHPCQAADLEACAYDLTKAQLEADAARAAAAANCVTSNRPTGMAMAFCRRVWRRGGANVTPNTAPLTNRGATTVVSMRQGPNRSG